ncbi:hypothetical protein GLE_2256 [Lysobacter enzymogenes]|uniref:Uncharacterized protein n=1 Tax=Lysobacter enzymogenes TaxID=69 RepID=A0A0S2DG46_LYSEN|nr:hypothetical protein GLE_2256 [Lysobacter enzymogenes]
MPPCCASAAMAGQLPLRQPALRACLRLSLADAERNFRVCWPGMCALRVHSRRTASCHSWIAKYCAPVSRLPMGFRKRE